MVRSLISHRWNIARDIQAVLELGHILPHVPRKSRWPEAGPLGEQLIQSPAHSRYSVNTYSVNEGTHERMLGHLIFILSFACDLPHDFERATLHRQASVCWSVKWNLASTAEQIPEARQRPSGSSGEEIAADITL